MTGKPATPDIEDMYPLTPLQRGLLFHTVAGPADGMYVVQLSYRVAGPLDVDALEAAWRDVVQAHPVLRSAFVWERVEQPMQAVLNRVDVPFTRCYLRHLSRQAQDEALARHLVRDREQGFPPARPPLLRIAVFDLGRDEFEMVWSHHHLLIDGWSAGVIVDHLFRCYRAARRGTPSSLPPVRRFRDYVDWLGRQDPAPARTYWRDLLAGFDGASDAPLAWARRSGKTAEATAGRRRRPLPAQVAERLGVLARRERITSATAAMGAWGLLLARYAGTDDVCFGATVAGRPAELTGAESMVGLFINTLPVRVRPRPGNGVLGYLRDLQRQLGLLGQYAYSPLNEVRRWAGQSRPSLFDTIVVVENYPAAGEGGDAGEVRLISARCAERLNYPLVLTVQPAGELAIEVLYDQTRYDEATVDAILARYLQLLDALTTRPHECILRDLAPLTAAEEAWLSSVGTGAQAPSPDGGVASLIQQRAERSPDAPAVDADGEILTYRELVDHAARLAGFLRANGLQPGDRVGICLPRDPTMLVALVAVLSAGGAYVPLDAEHPVRWNADILDDAGAAYVITSGVSGANLPAERCRAIRLDADARAIAAAVPIAPVPCRSDQAAYVLYTSGSTGRPKGVVVEHRCVTNFASHTGAAYDIGPRDRFPLLAPLSFDASVMEVFVPLTHGACVVIVDETDRRSAEHLQRRLREGGVTVAFITPTMAAMLDPDDIPSLRMALLGGERVPAELVDRWCAPHRRVLNFYGPTETTVGAVHGECRFGWGSPPPIGRPMTNVRVRVLGERLEPLPVGVPGELFIAGAGVARGYLNQPGLTAERFVPDEAPEAKGARAYRTGDRVRWLADGTLEFLGRIDRQVKLHGNRIELAEVEAALGQHPGVTQAVVEFRDDATGSPHLVAYLTGPSTPDIGAVRAFLADRVPRYETPTRVIQLEQMPLTPSGKLDRRSLPDPYPQRPAASDPVAPRDRVERLLADAFGQALAVDDVSVHDDFFELGGDSIVAMRVSALARQAGLALAPQELFRHPTIAALAGAISPGGAQITDTASVDASGADPEGDVPATPIQQWFFEVDDVAPQHYDQAVHLEVLEPIDVALLRSAVAALVEHHDGLRLRFVQDGSRWRQYQAADDGQRIVHRVDLSRLAAEEQQAAIRSTALHYRSSRDLANGPMLTVLLFDLGPDRPGRLLLTAHHLVVDVVSWTVLLEDLVTACGQLARGTQVSLPARTTSYRQWARRLAGHAGSDRMRGQAGWWRSVIDSATIRLPTDRRSGPDDYASEASVGAELDEAATTALLQRTGPRAGGIDAVLLAALSRALPPWTGRGTILVGVEHHGRDGMFDELDLSRTVGWFTSLYPVALTLDPDLDGVQSLASAARNLRAVPNHGIGYGVLRYLARAPGLEATFDIGIDYNGRQQAGFGDVSAVRPATESVGPLHSPTRQRPFLIGIEAAVQGPRLAVWFHYSQNRHDRPTVEALRSRFMTALGQLIGLGGDDADPTTRTRL